MGIQRMSGHEVASACSDTVLGTCPASSLYQSQDG